MIYLFTSVLTTISNFELGEVLPGLLSNCKHTIDSYKQFRPFSEGVYNLKKNDNIFLQGDNRLNN